MDRAGAEETVALRRLQKRQGTARRDQPEPPRRDLLSGEIQRTEAREGSGSAPWSRLRSGGVPKGTRVEEMWRSSAEFAQINRPNLQTIPGLLDHHHRSVLLLVRRVAVRGEDALDKAAEVCADVPAKCPAYRVRDRPVRRIALSSGEPPASGEPPGGQRGLPELHGPNHRTPARMTNDRTGKAGKTQAETGKRRRESPKDQGTDGTRAPGSGSDGPRFDFVAHIFDDRFGHAFGEGLEFLLDEFLPKLFDQTGDSFLCGDAGVVPAHLATVPFPLVFSVAAFMPVHPSAPF